MRILLAEDDHMIGEAVMAGLKDARYAADWVRDGKSALDALAAQTYDLLLLDLGLPKQDGLQVLQNIRRDNSALPILIVTARDDIDSRLRGLDGGADDYIIKPFDMAELLARMRAVMRRGQGSASPELDNGVIILNPATYEAKRSGEENYLMLSPREYAVLHALMSRPGIILSRSELEDKVYAWGEEVESNAIDYLIHQLRKKLGTDAIRNVRGVGWMVAKNGTNA